MHIMLGEAQKQFLVLIGLNNIFIKSKHALSCVKNSMRYFLLIIIAILSVGCAHINKTPVPPSVSTAHVINSLNDTKKELEQAGESNTKVAQNIDRAINLAERLNAILDQIEKEQSRVDAKQVKDPIK